MREFSDQKLRSTSRNRGLPPSQPTASKIASRIIGQSPAYEKLIFPNTFTAQAEAITGFIASRRSPVANLRSLKPMLCNVQKDEFRAASESSHSRGDVLPV